MRRISIAAVASLLFLSLVLPLVAQQPATGLPPLGSFQTGPFDTVNLSNLDAHLL